MPHLLRFALALVAFVPLTVIADEQDQDHSEAEKKAVEAAESWLGLVDQGEYAESWDAAAKYLQNAVDKDAFVKSLSAARKPLGQMESHSQVDQRKAI